MGLPNEYRYHPGSGMTLTRLQIPTGNYYAGNSGQRLLVLHTTEGAQTIQDLGNFFATGTDQASSHVGFDSTPNTIGEYVRRTDSAWTVASYNMVSRNGEFCTPSGAAANWTQADWMARPVMLANAAQWLREESQQSGIPLVKLTPAQAQSNGRGVCQHSDLGAAGGGHHDCGPGFPIDHVIQLARGVTPATPPQTEDDSMQVTFGSDNQAGIPLPNNVTHLRLSCSQGAVISVTWAGGTTPTKDYTLSFNQRADVAIPADQRGQVVLTAKSAAGPVGAVWLTPLS